MLGLCAFFFFFFFLSCLFFFLSLFPIRCRFWLCQPTFSSLKSGLSEVLLFLLQGSQADNPNSPIDKEIRRSVVGFRKSECCQMFLVTSIRSRGRFATSVPSTHSSADFLSASYFHGRQTSIMNSAVEEPVAYTSSAAAERMEYMISV